MVRVIGPTGYKVVAADEREVHRTLQRPETAGDFLTKLHHAPVAFGLIVGEGNGRIAKEARGARGDCVRFGEAAHPQFCGLRAAGSSIIIAPPRSPAGRVKPIWEEWTACSGITRERNLG